MSEPVNGQRRFLLEVTDLDAGKTKWIHVSGFSHDTPDRVALHARNYAREFYGAETEATPQRIAWFPGEGSGEEEGDGLDAA